MHFLPSSRIKDNAKFGISFVLKISVVFSLKDYIFIRHTAEMLKTYERKSKNDTKLLVIL